MVDVFSKFCKIKALHEKSAEEVVEAIRHNIINKHGHPKILLIDNGLEFVNAKMEELARNYNIKLKNSSPYLPTTTGAVERFNRTLLKKLRVISELGKYDWEGILEKAQYAINNSFSRPIKTTPQQLISKLQTQSNKSREDIRRVIEKYKEEYSPKNKVKNKFYAGDKVYYASPIQRVNKLVGKWTNKGVITDSTFKSYVVKLDNDLIVRTSERYIKPF